MRGRGPETNTGNGKNRTAERVLTVDYLLWDLKPWLHSTESDVKNSHEGLRCERQRQWGEAHALHNSMEWNEWHMIEWQRNRDRGKLIQIKPMTRSKLFDLSRNTCFLTNKA